MSDIMMNISYFGMSFLDPYLMFLTAAGVFFGIYVGAIPGLSVTMAVSILISFTFKWGVNEALALIAGRSARSSPKRLGPSMSPRMTSSAQRSPTRSSACAAPQAS